jgi:ribosomal protein L39E
MAEEKIKKEKPAKVAKEKKSIFKKKEKKAVAKIAEHKPVEIKKAHVSKRQQGYDEKKSKLVVKGRQTKWAPVWAVMKKYGTGKRVHPSAMTAYKRNWRRTKLHIKPRRIRKWHLG